MNFSSIVKGTLAIRAITLPLGGVEHPLSVRPLNGAEEGGALASALAYATAKGVRAPATGDRLYDLGLMIATVALGCVCHDDPARPFFDGGEAQILSHLDADRIAYLYEQHQAWQDECGVRASSLSAGAFIAKVMEVANARADEDPLARLRPGTHRSWERTLAALYVTSLQGKSSSGDDSGESTKSDTPAEADAAPAPTT